MNIPAKAEFLLISTGLFPDADNIESAIRTHTEPDSVRKIDLDAASMNESDWDDVISNIRMANKIITL